MKTILLGVVASLALTSLPVVHAEDTVNIERPRATRYFMDPAEFRSYANLYELSNGQHLAFKQVMTARYVKLDDGQYLRIHATSPKTFVTDSGVRFEFRDEGETVAVTDFARLPLAKAGSGKELVLASRR